MHILNWEKAEIFALTLSEAVTLTSEAKVLNPKACGSRVSALVGGDLI